eukprot:6204354-Pleurochrysis_carterae.AAC.4
MPSRVRPGSPLIDACDGADLESGLSRVEEEDRPDVRKHGDGEDVQHAHRDGAVCVVQSRRGAVRLRRGGGDGDAVGCGGVRGAREKRVRRKEERRVG